MLLPLSTRHGVFALGEIHALAQGSEDDDQNPSSIAAVKGTVKDARPHPPVQRVTMQVGTSRTFTFPMGRDLRASRRGVVDLYHRGRGVWEVTALRSGIVAIEASPSQDDQDDPSQKEGQRIYIEVGRKDESSPTVAQNFSNFGFCLSKSLRCNERSNSISGMTASPLIYRLALKTCRSMRGCLFDLKLSPSAKSQLVLDLQKSMGPSFHLLRSNQFPWIVRSVCDATSLAKDRDEINLRTDAAIQDGLLVLQCMGEDGANDYDLHTLIFLASTDTASEKGGSGVAQIKLAWDTPHASLVDPIAGEIRRILTDIARERTIRVIGEPLTRLRVGATVEVQSGGEFPFIVRGKEAAHGWKSHGLAIQASVTHLPKDLKLLNISATLRLKESLGSKNLAVQSLKSQIALPLDVPILAGTIDLDAEDSSGGETPWLAQIPFLGPFFRQKAESRYHSKLIIITRLTRAIFASTKTAISPEIAPAPLP